MRKNVLAMRQIVLDMGFVVSVLLIIGLVGRGLLV